MRARSPKSVKPGAEARKQVKLKGFSPVTLIENWVMRRQHPQFEPIRLERQRIYILPTTYGYLFALMLIVMLLWAINYNNSMGFALTFLLGAVGLNAMWRCRNNLLGLQVHPAEVDPVFAGQQASFNFRVANPNLQTRYGIALQKRNGLLHYADIPADGSVRFTLRMAAERRGLLHPGRLVVLTSFPLGLFQAWSWLEFQQACIVYPRPQGRRPLPLSLIDSTGSIAGEAGMGSDDYAGLRVYTPGDSPRHIAWKVAGRGNGLLVKRFVEQTHPQLWLDWRLLEPNPAEARLSQLCRWVLKAEAEGCIYGLRLPGLELSPARGEGHQRRCLEALAVCFPVKDRDANSSSHG